MDDVAPACYRHPGNPTRIVCQRCDRPICPECMVPGAVGFQCRDCVSQGAKEARQHALPYGGTRVANPRLTSFIIIGLNALVFAYILASGGAWGQGFNLLSLFPQGQCLAVDGYFPVGPEQCVGLGQWNPGVATGAWWQVVTSGFAHAAPLHILFNMLVVYMLGPNIEQILGRARFLAVYGIALLGGAAGVMVFSSPHTATLGASGAIYGLMGGILLLAWKHKGNVRSILIWLAINVVFTLTIPNVSWEGHLGGFLGGLAATAAIIYLRKERRQQQWVVLALVAAVFVGIIVWRALALV